MDEHFRNLPAWLQSIVIVLATLALTAVGMGLLILVGLLYRLAGKVWGW